MDSIIDYSLLSFVYGALDDIVRKNQWDFMQNIANQVNLSWIVIGGLNFILSQNEKQGGNHVTQTYLDKSNDIIDSNSLHSINYIGNTFTWTNRRQGHELILERIDRVVAYLDWQHNFPSAITYHLVPLASDHCLILLATARKDTKTHKPFRVNKMWFRDPSCKEIIAHNWNANIQGSAPFKLTKAIFHTKQILRE
ncbi:uncharacterized protein LOC113315939 [Papaver somniferum]|uniref:uncharacterized protein LOC113315939 n=1 Tax=Papaver somniferum TaxID=3469 RepID=UPI000E6FB0C3|nr:uncharacterized protein LOC113315939 [Papaver somniferum]